jgi:hypothetical protein
VSYTATQWDVKLNPFAGDSPQAGSDESSDRVDQAGESEGKTTNEDETAGRLEGAPATTRKRIRERKARARRRSRDQLIRFVKSIRTKDFDYKWNPRCGPHPLPSTGRPKAAVRCTAKGYGITYVRWGSPAAARTRIRTARDRISEFTASVGGCTGFWRFWTSYDASRRVGGVAWGSTGPRAHLMWSYSAHAVTASMESSLDDGPKLCSGWRDVA